MHRPLRPEHLVGMAEIAERLGLERTQVVHNWRRRYSDFPEPIAKLHQGLVFDWRDVEQWWRKWKRQ